MLIMPACTQLVGDTLNDLPIRATTFKRFKHFIESLDASLSAGEGAFLFQARCSGQDNIGVAAGIAEENVLHDKEIELGECISNVVGVGIHDAHFLTDEIHSLDLAVLNSVHHLVVVQSLGGRQLDLPTGLESL